MTAAPGDGASAAERRVARSVSRRRARFRALLVAASVAAALAGAEIALALFRPVEFMKPPEPVAGGVWRDYLHRASDVPGLAYELAPDREGSHRGTRVVTSSLGMRDDEPLPPGSGATRIAVVGDSVTFGFAVEADETYAHVLEQLLNERADPGQRFETLNFGVGGYSTRDEALVFEHKVLPLDPDLVVIGYALNDADPRPIQPLHQHFVRPQWWQHSNLLRLLARWAHSGELVPDGGRSYSAAIYAEDSPTWQSVVDGFGRIGELAAARGIPVLVVVFPRLKELGQPRYEPLAFHRQVTRAAEAAGLQTLDLQPVFARVPAHELRNPRDLMHPSVRGHRLAAEAIADWLDRHPPGKQ